MDDATEKTFELQRNLQKFIDKVDELRNEDDPSGDGFTREFIEIRDHGQKMKAQNVYPAEEGKKTCNIKKNRYRDILPFDETRVTLTEIPGEEGSDYINANFIRSHVEQLAYIASQGPLPHTVNDFWRMIMQYNIKVVAMACQLAEMGRVKCAQYWPEEEGEDNKEEFGNVTVTMLKEEEYAENCIKRELKAVQGNKELLVTQFHYTYWPDHDIPKDFDAILEMMAEMRQIRSDDPEKSPILVHCSAGCGRTGTICAIDYSWEILQKGCLREDFSLYDITMEMRQQRQSMIQTPDQYMMAHVIIQQLFQKHLEMIEDHTYGNVDFNSEETAVGDDTASISSLKSSSRKNSLLSQEIENTLRKVSGDNLSLTDSKSVSSESAVPPISPIVEESNEQVKSPLVKDIAAIFSVENIQNIPNKPKLAPQPSLTSDGKKKHVTTISIGGAASKQPLIQTKSSPVVPTVNSSAGNISRANTTPAVKDKPQSSLPPTLPAQSSNSVYSYAKTFEPPQVTDSSYSTISNYSSVKQTNQNADNNSAGSHTYHVLEKTGESTLGTSNADGTQPVYSTAKEPNMYSQVMKPKMNEKPTQNRVPKDDVYEAVQVGERGPPPIPDRGYLDDGPNNNNNNDRVKPLIARKPVLASVGKQKSIVNELKDKYEKFTGGKSHGSYDTNSHSDVPGFKQKIGSKPKGPRDPPWKKK